MNRKVLMSLLAFLFSSFCLKGQSHFPVYNDTGYHYIGADKMIVNNDGSIVVLASFNEFPAGHFLSGGGYVVCKYDAGGNRLWCNEFRSNFPAGNWMFGSDMVKDYDSGYVIVGDSSFVTGMVISPNLVYLVKIDESGNRVWTSAFNDSDNHNFAWDLKIKKADVGRAYYVSDFSKVLKFDAFGNHIYSNTNYGILANFSVLDNELVFGDWFGIPGPEFTFTDTNFNVVNGTPIEAGNELYNTYLTSDSCWLSVGRKLSTNTNAHIVLEKFSRNGAQIWTKHYNYNAQANPMNVIEHNGNYYITASDKQCLNPDTASRCTGVAAAVIIQTDTSGNELADLVIPGDGHNMDSVRSYYGIESVFTGDTLVTFGSAQLLNELGLGIEGERRTGYVIWKNLISSFIPYVTSVYTINTDNTVNLFPNPASDQFEITTTSCYDKNIKITIANMTGQGVYDHTFQNFNSLHISTLTFPAGMYIVSLKADNFVLQKKLVIMKN